MNFRFSLSKARLSGTSAGLYAPSRCNDPGQGSTASFMYSEVRKTNT